jgi:hypothetical protein
VAIDLIMQPMKIGDVSFGDTVGSRSSHGDAASLYGRTTLGMKPLQILNILLSAARKSLFGTAHLQ